MLRIRLVLCLFAVVIAVLVSGSGKGVMGMDRSLDGSEKSYAYYLPTILMPDQFTSRAWPIWSHSGQPSSHEVNLFRSEFALSGLSRDSKVYIFADTRYELWLDGRWIGRGPSRFSNLYREYDVYSLDDLSPGQHTMAVLVQWAPNIRRSESTTPYVQAYLKGSVNGKAHILTRTDPNWKALLSDAWLGNSVPVHTWGLIGPTEIIDLRKYPSDWMFKDFDDNAWHNAVLKDLKNYDKLTSILYSKIPMGYGIYMPLYDVDVQESSKVVSYQPRTIPHLTEKEFTYDILDAGLVSPGSVIMDFAIPPDTEETRLFDFVVQADTELVMERLSGKVENPQALINLDGKALNWVEFSAMRPDVEIAQVNISPGKHQLLVKQSPGEGVRLSLSKDNIVWGKIPFEQGINAGKRLLLSKYVSDKDVIDMRKSGSILFDQGPSYLILDVGRVIHGRLVFDILGSNGTVVDIGWDERLFEDTYRPLPYPGTNHPQWNQTDSWILDGNKRQIRTIDARTGRYILLVFWGDGPVTLENIHVLEERYPVNQSGFFDSTDELLNQVWNLGVETAYPNMTDAYADPWRERGQWWGDAYIVDRVNRVSFGEVALLRRGIKLMADDFISGKPVAMAPNGNVTNVHMLDYAMLWVHSLQEYLLLTNDMEFLLEIYPTLIEFLTYLKSYEYPSTGLLDLPPAHWSQTAYIDSRAYNDRYGQSTAVNSIYYATLLKSVWIADVLGDAENANTWQLKADHIKYQINDLLFDPITKRYFSSFYNGGYLKPTAQAQAWALTYRIVPEDEEDYVADALLELLSDDPANPNVGIYGMNWIFEGLKKAERVQEAVDIIYLYYGYLLGKNATTLWERFDADKFYNVSLSHGWGGSPTWFLSTYILGTKWTGLGMWQVKPSFSVVEGVSGAIPTTEGILIVDWDAQNCQNKILNILSPDASNGSVIIPVDTNAMVEWNDRIIWESGQKFDDRVEFIDSELYVTVQGGNHHFDIIGECFLP